MSPLSALPRARRATAAMCVAAAIVAFIAPAPAAMAEEPTPPVADAPAAAPAVTFEGTNAVGDTITPKFSEPLPAGTLQYEYLRDGVVVQRTVRSDRLLMVEDFGKRLEFRASLIAEGQEPVVVATGTTEPVLGKIYWRPFANGRPIVGQTSYFSPSGLTVPALPTAPTATYTWFRNGQPIEGATDRTYPVTEADLGATITGTVEFSAPGYLPIKTFDTFGTATRGYLQLATAPQLTWTTSAPITAGSVLSVSSPAVQPANPAGLTYEYQWHYTTGYSSTAIPGATGPTYTVRAEDSTKILLATVKAVAPGYDLAQRSSNWSPTVQGRFTATSAPRITGTALAGQLLTAVPGTAPSPAADSVGYVWYRDGQRVSDWSTDPTYRLTPEDGGHKITVQAFYNKANYIQAVSPASAAVTPPGYFTTGPAWIVGTAALGYTVSARTSYTSPSPTTALFQWLRDGKLITGATGTSYRLTAADQWHTITFRVTFKRAGTLNATVTSRSIRPLAVFTKLPTPVVRGTFAAGQVLRASTALPYPAPTSVTWQWQREGRPIPGATASTYRLTANDRDKFIRVVATFKRANYLTTARASASRWVP